MKKTKFFDSYATSRQQKNKIKKTTTNSNEVQDKEEDIAVAFRNYFVKLFTTSSPSQEDQTRCTEVLEPKVIDFMNDYLTRSYTKEESFEALQHMGPHKSPDLDGYGARFYQHHWRTMGEDISNVVLKILHSGE